MSYCVHKDVIQSEKARRPLRGKPDLLLPSPRNRTIVYGNKNNSLMRHIRKDT